MSASKDVPAPPQEKKPRKPRAGRHNGSNRRGEAKRLALLGCLRAEGVKGVGELRRRFGGGCERALLELSSAGLVEALDGMRFRAR